VSFPLLEPRVARAEALARQVEAELAAGAVAPGERLGTKAELRLRYGVAAGTLNEALRLLTDRGLVDARPGPGGGLFAAAPRAGGTAEEGRVVRDALEPLVAADAAAHATPQDAAALRALVGTDHRLHRAIARLARNSVLVDAYLAVLPPAERPAGPEAGRELVEAIAANDPRRAARVARRRW